MNKNVNAFKMLLFIMASVRYGHKKIFSQGFMGKWLSKEMSSGRCVRGWELTGERKAIQQWAGSQAVSPKETSGNFCRYRICLRDVLDLGEKAGVLFIGSGFPRSGRDINLNPTLPNSPQVLAKQAPVQKQSLQ